MLSHVYFFVCKENDKQSSKESEQVNKTDTQKRRYLSANWQPIRFHVDTHDIPNKHLNHADAHKLDHIIKENLKEALKLLAKFLHVIPVHGNLKLKPHMFGAKHSCIDVKIPASHEQKGVPNTDFILYVTANTANHGATLARGGSCRVKLCYAVGRKSCFLFYFVLFCVILFYFVLFYLFCLFFGGS